MSWRGLRQKPAPMPLWLEEWNANVAALNDLYSWLFEGVADAYFSSVRAGRGEFSGELVVGGRKVVVDGDPVYVGGFVGEGKNFERFLREVLQYIKEVSERIRDITATIRDAVREWAGVRLYATASAIETLEIEVGSEPRPLVGEPLRVRRIVIKNPSGSTYVLYLGGPLRQSYPLLPGESESLAVEDAGAVYIRSSAPGRAYVLIELL